MISYHISWYFISNYWMRLSRIWRILQIKEGAIHRGRRPRVLWVLGRGCYPQRPKSKVDNTLQDLQNSSYPTRAVFNNCLLFIQNIFPFLKEFFSVNSSIICSRLHFWRLFWHHRFNHLQRAALLTSLVQYLVNSSWLWWIMHSVLTNQKQRNILNE